MVTNFDKEMQAMQREIAALKQQKEKSAGLMRVKEYKVSLSFEMETHSFLYTYIRSKLLAVIDIDTNGLSPLTSLDFEITSLDDRLIEWNPLYNGSTGHIGYLVSIYSQNQSDYDILNAGGSLTLNYTANIKSTADVTINTSYQNLWPY